jgi:formylglycine-generating enzyme required for sulfatase activity
METLNATANNYEFCMIPVQGGSFNMGDEHGDLWDACRPVHQVHVPDFYIGKYPVTQALWKIVMADKNPSNFQGDDCPVENVSWDDIQQFLTKLNEKTGLRYRLPTEAEWEYAARGGKQSKGYLYAGGNTLNDVAWNYNNSGSKTHSVGGKTPNELGLYDMSGNVWEWCQDVYKAYPCNSNNRGNSSYRVCRGGGWINGAQICRAAYRDNNWPRSRLSYIGFRLALSTI